MRGIARLILLTACMLTGCTWWGATRIASRNSLSSVQTTYSTADLRAIQYYDYKRDGSRVEAGKIVCAEPSPDVAKAMSQALAASVNAEGKTPPTESTPSIEAALAGALSKSNAESMAQLTNRLATIQLLRDAMYRACEAYANGAISDTTYTAIVSQYGETVMTLLIAELAASKHGGKLAVLGMKANGESDAGGEGPGTEAGGGTSATNSETNSAPLPAVSASAKTSAETANAQGVEMASESSSKEVAAILETIQRNYLNQPHTEAIEIACMNALDRADIPDSVFAEMCLLQKSPDLYRLNLIRLRDRERCKNEKNEKKVGNTKCVRQEAAETLEASKGLELKVSDDPIVEPPAKPTK